MIIDETIQQLINEAYALGWIDPSEGSINLQIQVQVQFLASELLEQNEIDEATYQKICQRVEALYPD